MKILKMNENEDKNNFINTTEAGNIFFKHYVLHTVLRALNV